MRTARSLIVSQYFIISHACPPGATAHAPQEQPHMPPGSNHAYPPEQPRTPPRATTHPLEQPCTPPQSNHTPPGATTHAPPPWTEWQTGVKILPCPKLRLRAVIKTSYRCCHEQPDSWCHRTSCQSEPVGRGMLCRSPSPWTKVTWLRTRRQIQPSHIFSIKCWWLCLPDSGSTV